MLTETAPHTAATATDPALTCRLCGSAQLRSFLDLGATPPCELFLPAEAVERPEVTYPLHVRVCESCLLAQLPPLITPEETFTEYAYFSSFSTSWVEHARRFVDGAVERLGLGPDSFVVEVASNDGYLLQHVVARGIRCLGIEPSVNVGEAAREKGVPTLTAFLTPRPAPRCGPSTGPRSSSRSTTSTPTSRTSSGSPRACARWSRTTAGCRSRCSTCSRWWSAPSSTRSTTSTSSTTRCSPRSGRSHPVASRWWTSSCSTRTAGRCGCGRGPVEVAGEPSQAVRDVLAAEQAAGLHTAEGHDGFAAAVSRVRDDLVAFLIEARRAGKTVVGYGAPGKGNTLLNYCGIRPDLLAYTVDRNPYKHGRFTPGTRIPVLAPEQIAADRPDYVLVLPWNLRTELTEQLSYIREWGGRLVFPIPTLEVV